MDGSGLLAFLILGGSGCSHYRYPVNARLTQWDPEAGYRGKNLGDPLKEKDLLLLSTFSGGGTRAAAFSYGVWRPYATRRSTGREEAPHSLRNWTPSRRFPAGALPPPTTVFMVNVSSGF